MNASIGMLAFQGAAARAAILTPERRREIAREAARARWAPRIAHQRIIRDRAAESAPREPLANLDGCTVSPVTRAQAKPIILRYEWLGTLGRAKVWYGLHAPDGELLGVVGFGGTAPRDLPGSIILERGACVHWAPKNAASFLIRRAVRLAHREHGWTTFVAYADPDAARSAPSIRRAAGATSARARGGPGVASAITSGVPTDAWSTSACCATVA